MRHRGSIVVACALAIAACSRRPSEAELDRLLEEARAAEQDAVRAHGQADERDGWTLAVVGEVEQPISLSWQQIEAMRATEVVTRAPAEDSLRSQHASRWRGVRLDALVDRARPHEGVTEVTLVAYDGFRATVQLDDARRFPLVLAYESDGQPIPRASGGPLYAVYPIDEHPELRDRYDGRFWVFYVTHVIVGTAAPALRVGARTLDADALAALPRTTIVETVGYRTGWPSEPVRLEGVRLRDLLAAADEEVGRGEHVRVVTIAPISHGDARPTRVRADDVLGEDVIVALWWGERREPIPARLGGPIALAFPAHVGARLTEHDWLTFVEAIEVER